MSVEFEDVTTLVSDDVAVAHAFVTFKGLSADGTELRAMNNRPTWALEMTPHGGWKIVHEHRSGPADFDTGKVQLRRQGSG